MFSQALSIYHQVKMELPLGSGNVAGASSEAIERTEFLTMVYNEIVNKFIIPAQLKRNYTQLEAEILSQMVAALISQAYQCASCVGHSSLVFVKALEYEVSEAKEQVQITGSRYLKTESFSFNDGRHGQRFYTCHNITLLGRDAQKSKLNDISTYRNFTVIDTWRVGRVCEYKGATIPRGVELVDGWFEPTVVDCNVRLERTLNSAEWKRYSLLLSKVKVYIGKNFQKWFAAANRTHNDSVSELAKVNVAFDLRIKYYKRIGDYPFLFRHWTGNTNTLFQPTKSNASHLAKRREILVGYNAQSHTDGVEPNPVASSSFKKIGGK